MDGVESVRHFDDKRLHWRVNIGGKVKEWDAEITEQHPDERIAWTTQKRTPGHFPRGGVASRSR